MLFGIEQSCYMTATNQAQAVCTNSLCADAKFEPIFLAGEHLASKQEG